MSKKTPETYASRVLQEKHKAKYMVCYNFVVRCRDEASELKKNNPHLSYVEALVQVTEKRFFTPKPPKTIDANFTVTGVS